jgi:hypothetical protein
MYRHNAGRAIPVKEGENNRLTKSKPKADTARGAAG